MASNIKDFLIAALIPMIKAVGKMELNDILNNIKKNNTQAIYENTLKSINSTFTLLRVEAMKTKTHIDEGLIDTILEAVQESASENGVTL